MSTSSILSPERRIELNPFDVDAWNLLLRESSARPIDQARIFYEKLVTQFPNAGRYWKAYIEHELRAKNIENVEKLFERCLFKVLHIDLWKSYVYYMKETKGHLPDFREQVVEAFDCAIDRVGIDIQASQIYLEYIQFLKNVEVVGQYAENQKVSAVRKVYQKAFSTPVLNLDGIWQDYCTFEKAVNVNLAEKLIADRVKEYQHVKKVLKQMEQIMQGLNRQAISVPPRGTVAEQKQVDLWRKYIAFEKTNPLRTEEVGLKAKRVIYAYDQALLSLGYHADIWYESACFHEKIVVELKERGDLTVAETIEQETSKLYNRATSGLMKDTPLIHFAHADFEETKGNYDMAKVIYDKLINFENSDPTLAYIMLMNFVRRTEGVRAARQIFQRARNDKRCQFHIYIAGALMEFHCSKDANVAQKIFDHGLKQYGNIPEFATAYVDFLTHVNDDNNTRVVIERLLESHEISTELRIDMWDRYLDLETRVGNATSLHKVDMARRQALNETYEDRQALFLVDRFKFLNLWPCTSDQLKLMGYNKINRLNSGNSTTAATNPATNSRYMNQAGPRMNVNLEISGYPRPDTNQMLAFKAASRSTPSFHPVTGGTFPPPRTVAFMLQKLPPPDTFAGPFVDTNHLMDTLAQFNREPPRANYKESIDVNNTIGNIKVADMKREFQQLVTTTTDPAVLYASEEYKKHQRKRRNDSDSEEETNGTNDANGDVFKRRMNAKVRIREMGQS
uniref:Suppressor of forked domain-containing protein n=1 Tax=Panagrolaimus davidi TaxID=227884 RepID=A0A914PND0_9BILA